MSEKNQISVLINCYNYELYVKDAILSVGAQTRRPDELIVVDDGSTDGSVAEIEQALAEIGFGRLVKSQNRGQLAALELGFEESSGEWLFFLDADDLYQPEHIETVVGEIVKNPKGDFFFSDIEEFGDGKGEGFRYQGPTGDLGYSALLVLAGFRCAHVFVGGVTSSLCIRRNLLKRYFPLGSSFWSDWKTRADNVLVFGTSVAGARKFSLVEKTVRYRIHKNNHFAGARRDKTTNTWDFEVMERLMGRLGTLIPYSAESLSGLGIEYRGLPAKNSFVRKAYWRTALRLNLRFWSRLRVLAVMLKSDVS